uniref:PepSY-like domain-containing protein n=1 Tax=Alistipes sp. TaxID=1872444 RepID=UPI004056150F
MKQKVFIALLLLAPLFVWADERPIQFEELPKQAREVVLQHFASHQLSYAKYDSDLMDRTYDVIFTDGSKIEFDYGGEWNSIECRRTARVPEALLPDGIGAFVAKHHADTGVVEIERGFRSFEVRLSNGLELIFNSEGTFRRYDE